MENKIFEDEIDLMRLFNSIFRRVWIVIAVAIVFACGTAGYTYFRITPTYTSTTAMLILAKETTITSLTSLADLQLGSQLTKDYTVLITSRPVLEEVIENLELKMHYRSLRGCISINNPEDTRILYVSVTLPNAQQAKETVDELAQVASTYIGETMEITPPKIIEEGEVAVGKTSPNIKKNTIMGFLAGAILTCAVIVVLELLNDSVRTEEDIEKYLKVPALAVVPNKGSGKKKGEKGKAK